MPFGTSPQHLPVSYPATAIAAAKLLPMARLVELSGHQTCARTSTAVSWLVHTQAQSELTAWVQATNGSLFPPDLAEAGVDLDALVIVEVPSGHALIHATELLLRSSAFGLVVVDLIDAMPPGSPNRWQGRLQALLRKHESKVCLLTSSRPDEPSAGPLVELRVQTMRTLHPRGTHGLHYSLLKNKIGVRDPIAHSQVTTPEGL